MLSPGDEQALEQLVGSQAFARGGQYVRAGAVVQQTWDPSGARVVGKVQGSANQPYVTSVTLTRGRLNQLASLVATCSCPVGVDCKHAVALVLANGVAASSRDARPPTAGRSRAERSAARSSSWDIPLRALLGSALPDDDPGSAEEIALQFELVANTQSSGSSGPSIRVRPLTMGRTGRWNKSHVSWSNLDYFHFGPRESRQARARLALVKELLALSRASQGRYGYRYGDDMVRLEVINSRRLWDLLAEARALGLPLLGSGPRVVPLTVPSAPASVTVDVIRSARGLRLEPRIKIEDLRIASGSSLFIGSPAHGIAWWGTQSHGAEESSALELGLAPLGAPVDAALRDLLESPGIVIPRGEESRFFGAFLPRLRRKMVVESSDGSVELPLFQPTLLFLEIEASEGQHLELTWMRGTEGGEWREHLWEVLDDGAGSEDRLVDAVTTIVRGDPELFEQVSSGRRLAGQAVLEGMTAVRFITERLPLLEAIDDVRVERIGPVPDYHEVLAAPVVRLEGSTSPGNDWLDLTVTVSVGGEDVQFSELFVALAEGRSHLFLASGTYFSLEHPELVELAQLIAEARALNDTPVDRLRLSRFQASLWEDLRALGTVSAQAAEWEASVRSLVESSDRPALPAPSSFRATLRPYQHIGFEWLAFLHEHRLGGILADDMGLGKTLQALALMCHTIERGTSEAPYLVVSPTSVVGNWASECRRFAPELRVVAITETQRRSGTKLVDVIADVDVVVASYSLFRIDYDEYATIPWAGLFLDEAQMAKNHRSQTYQRAKMLPVAFKVAMSGTPIENHLMELWSLLSITSPGLFSSSERFGEYYRVPIEVHGDTERLAQLRRRVRPLLLRRTKEQVAGDLPDKQEQVLELDLNPRHKRAYETYLQRERQKVLGLLGDMDKHRFKIFKSLTLLRQASLDVSLVDDNNAGVPSTKLDALMEMLDDIVDDGHRVLVFSQFTRFLALARARLRKAGIEHCYLDGRTRNRPAAIAEFREGTAPAFLISLKAGGFGLNLTEADYCILLDPWWNPATEAQAVDRIHRIGQTRKVMVYRLVAKDTIEEKVMALKAKKAALFSDVLNGGGFESGAISAADIRGLLD